MEFFWKPTFTEQLQIDETCYILPKIKVMKANRKIYSQPINRKTKAVL